MTRNPYQSYQIPLPLNADTQVPVPLDMPAGLWPEYPDAKVEYVMDRSSKVEHGGGHYQFDFSGSDPDLQGAKVIGAAFAPEETLSPWTQMTQSDKDGNHTRPFWVVAWGDGEWEGQPVPFTLNDIPDGGDYEVLLLVQANGRTFAVDPEIQNDQGPG